MSFLHPILFAAGAAAVAAPIIIHLLMRRRRQPIKFGAMRFLIEAYQKQRKRMRLEQWLLLLTRCLLVLMVALAIGQPLLGSAAISPDRPRTLYVVIDDGIASGAMDGDGTPAIERHKQRARAALAELDPARGDRAALITAAAPATAVVSPPSGDLAAIGRAIDGLSATDAAADLTGALAAVGSGDGDASGQTAADARTLLVLTEWRAGSFPDASAAPPLDGVRVIAPSPGETAPADIAITAVTPRRSLLLPGDGSGAASIITVAARRQGETSAAAAVDARVTLTPTPQSDGADTRPIDLGTARLEFAPGQTETTARLIAAGETLAPVFESRSGPGDSGGWTLAATLIASPEKQDALPANDTALAPLGVRPAVRVGIVAEPRFGQAAGVASFRPADWLAIAIESGGDAAAGGPVTTVELGPASIDRPRLADLDALFITRPDSCSPDAWADVAAFASRGRLVVISPEPDPGPQTWPDRLTATRDAILPEPTEPDEPLRIDSGSAAVPGGLFALVRTELDFLAPPVRLSRVLGVSTAASAGSRVDLAATDGTPLITTLALGDQLSAGSITVLLFAPDLSWTDLPAKPLFVPLVQELLRQGLAGTLPDLASTAGDAVTPPTNTTELVLVEPASSIESSDDRRVAIESQNASPSAGVPIRRAGVWSAIDADGRTVAALTVRPDTAGADLTPTDRERAGAWLTGGGDAEDTSTVNWLGDEDADAPLAVAGGDPTPAGWWFLLAAAALALAEIPLARMVSHAAAGKRTASAGDIPSFDPDGPVSPSAPTPTAAA